MKVTEIMSQPVITVTPATAIKAAAALLVEHGISALPVLDPRGKLAGIVSEADLLIIEARPDPRSQSTPLPPSAGTTPRTVGDVMTRDVVAVDAGAEVSQAARAMLDSGIKRVPVVETGRVIGIVSRRDLMRVIARRDESVRREVAARLRRLGLGGTEASVRVKAGVITVVLGGGDQERRLVESVALGVPGVLEVRFADRAAARRR